MLLKINLQLKLSIHQKQHFYSLLGIALIIISIQSMVKNMHHGFGSIMFVNGNFSSEFKQRKVLLHIRNKVGIDFKVFLSENILQQINQLLNKLFCGQLSRKNFRTILQTLCRTALAFSSNSVQAGLAT